MPKLETTYLFLDFRTRYITNYESSQAGFKTLRGITMYYDFLDKEDIPMLYTITEKGMENLSSSDLTDEQVAKLGNLKIKKEIDYTEHKTTVHENEFFVKNEVEAREKVDVFVDKYKGYTKEEIDVSDQDDVLFGYKLVIKEEKLEEFVEEGNGNTILVSIEMIYREE